MLLDYAISALLTLFVVVDPIAMAPTFLVVTEGMPRASRRSVAVRASIIAGVILIGTALIGDWLLRTLEISLSAFRIAGGLLLFWIAAEMVFGVRRQHEGEEAEQALEERVRNIAAFPLAIPLLAGPGAITATLLLATRAGGNMILIGILIGVVLLIALSCWVTFVCRAHQRPSRQDRQYRAVAAARRAARGVGRAICGRRHPRDSHRMMR